MSGSLRAVRLCVCVCFDSAADGERGAASRLLLHFFFCCCCSRCCEALRLLQPPGHTSSTSCGSRDAGTPLDAVSPASMPCTSPQHDAASAGTAFVSLPPSPSWLWSLLWTAAFISVTVFITIPYFPSPHPYKLFAVRRAGARTADVYTQARTRKQAS